MVVASHEPGVADTAGAAPGPPTRRGAWALWGAAAGIFGAVFMVVDPNATLTDPERRRGVEVLELVERAPYHAGAVTGFLAVGCLLVAAVGWRRWSDARAGQSLAAPLVSAALLASAGAMIIGYGFLGGLAVYLPGGMDEGEHARQGLYTLYMASDLAPYFAWWGVAVAGAAIAWLALRERLLPRWIGVVGALGFIAPAVFLAATGLTGFAGIVGPIWLVIVSVGVALQHDPAGR